MALIRDRLRDLLCRHGYVAIPAASGEDALAIAQQGPIRLALLDILMPAAQIEGIAAARILTGTYRVPCLMLTSTTEAATRAAAMLAGAIGYVVKDGATGDAAILATVQAALAGQALPDPLAGQTLTAEAHLSIHQRARALEVAYATLSVRQRQVADLAAQGLTNAQIAAQLGLGESTITSHMEAVLARLNLNGRRELRVRVVYDSLLEQRGDG